MLHALWRLNVPQDYIDMIEAIYRKPEFIVRDGTDKSASRCQRAGIRQGCPLSPYLFILLMSVLMVDVHRQVDRKIWHNVPDVGHIFDILYADDTMIISQGARGANILLHAIEDESKKYDLELNKSKCGYIGINGASNVYFKDGSKEK